MARTALQDVPTALLEAWTRTVSTYQYESADYDGITKVPEFKFLKKDRRLPPKINRQAAFAAEWLANHNPAAVASVGLQQFLSDRKTELLTDSPSSAFWTELTASSDVTELATPYITTPGPTPPQEYWEATRLNCYESYDYADSSYPTPTPGSGLPTPSPGYRAEVINGIFQDLWAAQRRMKFSIPATADAADPEHLWIIQSHTVTASADKRGNKLMQSYLYMVELSDNGYYYYNDEEIAIGNRFTIIPKYRQRSETSPGYARTSTLHSAGLIPDEKWERDVYWTPPIELQMLLAPVTSMGKWHYLNSWQQSVWDFTVRVYWPKSE
jgi:hypothetical protein